MIKSAKIASNIVNFESGLHNIIAKSSLKSIDLYKSKSTIYRTLSDDETISSENVTPYK